MTNMTNITKIQLKHNLMILRQVLVPLNSDNLKNIRFINLDAFYDYINKLNGNKLNVKQIINNLERYIPICIGKNEELFYILETGLKSFDKLYINTIKDLIYKKTIINFIKTLSKVNNDKDFDTVFIACNNIRNNI